jgi:hypothetical protein
MPSHISILYWLIIVPVYAIRPESLTVSSSKRLNKKELPDNQHDSSIQVYKVRPKENEGFS